MAARAHTHLTQVHGRVLQAARGAPAAHAALRGMESCLVKGAA